MNRSSSATDLVGGAVERMRIGAGYALFAPLHRRRGFEFDAHRLRYHAALYNTTWLNERTVEVPIVLAALARRPGGRHLELGNVLTHYGVTGHTVVDRYEQAPGVRNVDVLDFEDDRGFNVITSISTVEHIGFDEDVRDPDKPGRAMEHLASLLAPGGEAIVTVPVGYNPSLDDLLFEGDPRFGELRALRRVSADNRWVAASIADLRGVRYGEPHRGANALVVARLRA